MKQPEILKEVNQDWLKHWLLCAGPPLFCEPAFFEKMGFPTWFVRQYFRKHRHVLRPGGQIQREVRGVSEVDFLNGLAEAMGITGQGVRSWTMWRNQLQYRSQNRWGRQSVRAGL